jgi:hypothetical protein
MNQLVEIAIYEFYHYIYDTFVLIEPTTDIANILNILNNFQLSIKFTYEIEENKSLTFLDVEVNRSYEQPTFDMAIYSKPTFIRLMTT